MLSVVNLNKCLAAITASGIILYAILTSTAVSDTKYPSGNRNLGSPVTSEDVDMAEQSDISCTFGLFRKYYRIHKYIPTGGKWVNASGHLRYQPNICKYRYTLDNPGHIERCVNMANISYIVTTGDSNGGNNYRALVSLLQSRLPCRRGRHDTGGVLMVPGKQYITFYDKSIENYIQTKFRFCGDLCASQEYICQLPSNNSRELVVEQIAMSMVLDDSIQISLDNKYYGEHVASTWALTNQEVVLRYYLKHRYPDVMIITLPFNHDKHIALGRLKLDIKLFRSLVNYYLPASTKVFYLPSFREFESRRTFTHKWRNRTFEGMLASEKIDKMNRMLYAILEEDLLDPSGRVHGFLNLWDVSEGRTQWSRDGVHMVPEWYQNTMAMFWETLCNSFNENDF